MHRFAVELAFDRLSKAKLPTAIASDKRFRLNTSSVIGAPGSED
jgi:hypothetical protein